MKHFLRFTSLFMFVLILFYIYGLIAGGIPPPAIFNGWFRLYCYTLKKNILTQNSHINFSNYYDQYDWDKIIFREQSPANALCQEVILLKNEKEVIKEYSACQDFDGFVRYNFFFKFKEDEAQRVYSRKEAIIPIHQHGWYIIADLTKGGVGEKWKSRNGINR